MKVVITSATEKEVHQIKQRLQQLEWKRKSVQISFHLSGVGILASCFSIAKLIFEDRPDLIIQAGIAGTFNHSFDLGKVIAVKSEILADTGVEENGGFQDLFDLNLQKEDEFPFEGRKLVNHHLPAFNYLGLDEVAGITINEITTRPVRTSDLINKYKADIESMEGGALHYCCLQTNTTFIQIRSISNYIGDRDKSKWNFKDSLSNLTETIIDYIGYL